MHGQMRNRFRLNLLHNACHLLPPLANKKPACGGSYTVNLTADGYFVMRHSEV